MRLARPLANSLFFFLFLLSCQPAVHAQEVDLSACHAQAERLRLSNGLTVVAKEINAVPFVSLNAFIKAGSANEGKYTGTGISHFVEHMLFKVTEKYGVGEIERRVKELGGHIEASTTFDYINCGISVPKENFEEALSVLYEMLFKAEFPPEEFEKEKNVVLGEMRLYADEPKRRINNLLYSSAYSVHPYRYPVIGEKERFEALSRDDLPEFYRTNFVPHKIVIAIAGDIETASAFGAVEELFSKIPPSKISCEPKALEPRQTGTKRTQERYDTKVALLSMGYHSVAISDKDLYPLDVLAALLADGESSRLVRAIKDKGDVYFIIAYNYTPHEPGLFVIEASLDEKNADRAIAGIRREIEILKAKPPSLAELARAKKRIKSRILLNLVTIEDHAEDIGSNELITDNPDFTRIYLKNIESVTPEGVRKAAKKYLNEENMTVAEILPLSGEKAPQTEKPPAAVIPAIQKSTLKNGMRLLIREDHALPTVTIRASFSGGVRAETERLQGISNLTARLLLKGTKSMSKDAIARLLDSLGGEVYTESGNNSFSIVMNLNNQDAQTGLALLLELIRNANFPQREVEREKELALAQIKSSEKDIFYQSQTAIRKALYAKHPFKFQSIGTEESMRAIGRADIVGFYEKFYVPENMVLAIFGDVDTARTLEKIKKFESMPQGRFKPVLLDDEPLPLERRHAEMKMEKEQALLMAGFLGTSVRGPDRYGLEVLTSILSHGGGRIFNQIRDELGLAYTLGSYNVLGIERGYYVFYVATTTDKVAAAKEKLFSIIESLKAEAPSEEEIAYAKRALVSSQALGLQGNAQFAAQAALDELYGLGCDDYLRYADNINKVSGEDLRRIAKKYFDLNSAVVVMTNADE